MPIPTHTRYCLIAIQAQPFHVSIVCGSCVDCLGFDLVLSACARLDEVGIYRSCLPHECDCDLNGFSCSSCAAPIGRVKRITPSAFVT